MSALGERILIQHLVDADSLAVIARDGIDPEVIPTEELRPVVFWAIEYFHNGGRTMAPSVEALLVEFGDLFADHEIPIDEEPDNTVEWAIEDLRGSFVHRAGQKFVRELAESLASASTAARPGLLSKGADDLIGLTQRLENHSLHVDVRDAISDRLTAYHQRADRKGEPQGIRFGLPSIDEFTTGIHPGELAVLAAGPKVGKSMMMCYSALRNWMAGNSVALYTLENSVEMMLDRIACFATGVPQSDWLHGRCSEAQVADVEKFIQELATSQIPFGVHQPEPGKRSVTHIVRDAQLRGAQSLFIDQLTHLEVPVEDLRRPRHEQVGNMLAVLRNMLNNVHHRIPCLIAHQINREGVQQADKAGRLEMYHMAESAGVERTADWAFGIYQSNEAREAEEAMFQVLAARREDVAMWKLGWAIPKSRISVMNRY
jgi:replicative DNA helicase